MDWITSLLIPLLVTGVFAIGVLAAGAYATVFERKLCGRFQVRYGPNRAGKFGVLQPIADAIKAFMKEEIVPHTVDKLVYIIAPGIAFAAVVITFGVIPIGQTWNIFGYNVRLQIADIDVGLLYIMAVAGLGGYGIVLGGWSSNNKYSLLGALRTTAQLISYELPMGLALVGVAMVVGSLRMSDIVRYQHTWPLLILQPVGFILYLISGFAENNRSPFRPAGDGKRAGVRVRDRVRRHQICPVLHRRVREHGRHQLDRGDSLPRRVAVARVHREYPPGYLGRPVRDQSRRHDVPVCVGSRQPATRALRQADEIQLAVHVPAGPVEPGRDGRDRGPDGVEVFGV